MRLGSVCPISGFTLFALTLTAVVTDGGMAQAELPSVNLGGSTRIAVAVDNDVCRTIAAQCTGAGFIAPANGNRIPIGVRFQALNNAGVPVNTITDANVAISTKFVPAGGALVTKRSCTDCFQFAQDGVYGFFVEPIAGQTWKSGTYYLQVQVTKGTFVARALTELKIPF